MTVPTQEQMLYAQLSTAEALVEYIRDNIADSKLETIGLNSSIKSALQYLQLAHYCMKMTLAKTQEAE